jgi:glutamyl-Q tRNA(Asp) synthetase
LHFGSLVAAVASYLDARSNGGRWLLRIEDIDPPREQDGADRLIIDALERYGFAWDGAVSYQSQFKERHLAALQQLADLDMAYPCSCSRRDLADAPRGPLGTIYPGTCRSGCSSDDVAIRVRTDNQAIEFDDRLQGPQSQRLEAESGDFVIRRRDGLIAYQLAVAVDDADQGITDVVRGIDLMPSTPRQVHLQHLLGLATPRYAHIPVVEHPDGSKLSKLTGAPAIPGDAVKTTLVGALAALGQQPAEHLARETIPAIWNWAVERWRIGALSGQKSIALQHYC